MTGGCCSACRRTRLSAATLDPDAEPHLLVLGEGGSGRSAALRTYLREVVAPARRSQAAVVPVAPALAPGRGARRYLHRPPGLGAAGGDRAGRPRGVPRDAGCPAPA